MKSIDKYLYLVCMFNWKTRYNLLKISFYHWKTINDYLMESVQVVSVVLEQFQEVSSYPSHSFLELKTLFVCLPL